MAHLLTLYRYKHWFTKKGQCTLECFFSIGRLLPALKAETTIVLSNGCALVSQLACVHYFLHMPLQAHSQPLKTKNSPTFLNTLTVMLVINNQHTQLLIRRFSPDKDFVAIAERDATGTMKQIFLMVLPLIMTTAEHPKQDPHRRKVFCLSLARNESQSLNQYGNILKFDCNSSQSLVLVQNDGTLRKLKQTLFFQKNGARQPEYPHKENLSASGDMFAPASKQGNPTGVSLISECLKLQKLLKSELLDLHILLHILLQTWTSMRKKPYLDKKHFFQVFAIRVILFLLVYAMSARE